MAMPRKLKLMNVFLNGYSYQGVAKSVTLPKTATGRCGVLHHPGYRSCRYLHGNAGQSVRL